MESLRYGLDPVVNLTSESTESALALAAACESIRVRVVNLTPRWKVDVPVRIVEEPVSGFSPRVAALEEAVRFWVATKSEFRLLAKICRIIASC